MTIYIFSYLAVINFVTFIVYAVDKYKAIHDKWRISEATLLTFAGIGGSFGALMSMYTFRHKTKKPKFTVSVPAMFMVHVVIVGLLFYFGWI